MAAFRQILKSEILNCAVAAVEAYGSSCMIGLPDRVMKDSDLLEYERVQVWHAASGRSFEGFVKSSQSEGVSITGSVAQYVREGDELNIAAFVHVSDLEARDHKPKRVFLGDTRLSQLTTAVKGPLFYSTQKTV